MGVKIRVNRGKLYLDIYRHGKRRWEALKLSVGNDKQADKEAMRVAEICRAKRELQLVSGDWGIADPVSGSKTFLAYTREIGAERSPKDRVNLMARYLERYPGGNIQIAQIGAKWIEDFQTYLLTRCGLSRNTAASYSTALRIVLNRAVRDSVIPRNPAA
ncbi:MAG: phage integrase SAM-like domain-containing protein [Treponema sp.]|jgi:hypothetical protein|nr:phage integrase SAM-like domain-containing protein [Treponema sp.]